MPPAAEAVRSRWMAADSMREGGRRYKVEVVGGATPLVASCGVMPLGEDGGVMLPRGDDSAMP